MRSLLFVFGLTIGLPLTALAQDADATEPDTAAMTPTASEDTASESPRVPVTLRLKNSITMRGSVTAEALLTWTAGTDVELVLEDGTSLIVPGAQIRAISGGDPGTTEHESASEPPTADTTEESAAPSNDADGFSFPNAAATRYLYAPSAIPMQKGQGYVSQKLLITSVAYAVADHTTFVLGTFSFFPPALTVAAVKTAFPVADKVHLGVGGETFLTSFGDSGSQALASVAFGNITFGDLNTHLTLASGYLNFDGDHAVPVVLAGHHRINDRLAFVTENWLIIDPGNEYEKYRSSSVTTTGGATQTTETIKTRMTAVGPVAGLLSGSVRFIGRRDWETQIVARGQTTSGYPKSTVDVGLIVGVIRNSPNNLAYDVIGPIPWVDWSWHFGPARR